MGRPKGQAPARGARVGEAALATTPSIRAFVALDLDTMSVRRVMRIADRLRMASGAPSASWTTSAKVHLTLAFLGQVSVDAVDEMTKALASVDVTRPPSLGASMLTAFPSVGEAEVIVLEMADPDGDVARLAASLARVAARHGASREARAYRPHVTLARVKRPYDTHRWLNQALAEGADFTAARVVLYRSEPGADKDGTSLYVPLAKVDYAAG